MVTYYKDGTQIAGKTYDECFVWEINVAVTKDAPVQLTYAVRLTNPQTASGTYGEYDQFGENGKDGLYTNNSATLFPVDSEGHDGTPEDFNKPTVDYTVETPDPGPGPSTTSLTVTKVWADNGDEAEARPDSITVTLLRDGQPYSTYTLDESNSWKHTFSGLSRSYTWSVAEADVPEGYVSEVTGSGRNWMITNTYDVTDLDEGDVPTGELPDDPGQEPGDDDTDLGDGDVPMGELPDVPQTGDLSALWLTISGLSGAALAGMGLGKRKKDEE